MSLPLLLLFLLSFFDLFACCLFVLLFLFYVYSLLLLYLSLCYFVVFLKHRFYYNAFRNIERNCCLDKSFCCCYCCSCCSCRCFKRFCFVCIVFLWWCVLIYLSLFLCLCFVFLIHIYLSLSVSHSFSFCYRPSYSLVLFLSLSLFVSPLSLSTFFEWHYFCFSFPIRCKRDTTALSCLSSFGGHKGQPWAHKCTAYSVMQ